MPKKIYLKTARTALVLTQRELADVTRVLDPKSALSQNTVSRLETDPEAEPTYRHRAVLARALRVPIDDLCFGPDPKEVATRALQQKHEDADARATD